MIGVRTVTTRTLVSALALWLQLAAPAHADTPAETPAHALLAVRDACERERVGIAMRFGDGAILRLLDERQALAVRIAAMRAAPWLAEPHAALEPLSRCIDSADSDLAEAAARATLAIARRLDARSFDRLELDPRALGAVVARLHALLARPFVRADLRLLAAAAAAQLEAAGVEAPKSD